MAWVRHVLCITALWTALRVAREMTRPRTCHALTSSHWRHCSWTRRRRGQGGRSILHHVRTTVIIAIRKTTVVASARAWWEHRWYDPGSGVILVIVRVEGTAGYTAPCSVAGVWFGARLCAHSYTLFLYWSVGFEISCGKSNWKTTSEHVQGRIQTIQKEELCESATPFHTYNTWKSLKMVMCYGHNATRKTVSFKNCFEKGVGRGQIQTKLILIKLTLPDFRINVYLYTWKFNWPFRRQIRILTVSWCYVWWNNAISHQLIHIWSQQA